MTNKNVLLSYHGVHSDHPQDAKLSASTAIKVVLGVGLVWLLVIAIFCIGD